jgi:GAF domain-containing protein
MSVVDSSAVLTAVARLVAEAPNLRDLVSGLALALRDAVPFERLQVLRLDRAESFVLYVVSRGGDVSITGRRIDGESIAISAESPDDRSRILCAARQGTRMYGAVWVSSSQENAFSADHQALLDSVVDLLGVAFEHTAIVDRETLRRERIDSLRGLLHTMAESLDLRSVFNDVSDVVRGGLPHDMLVMTSWGRGRGVVPHLRACRHRGQRRSDPRTVHAAG